MKKYKIAFLDRDGVINKSNINGGYIGKINHLKFVNGALNAIKLLKKKNFWQALFSLDCLKYSDIFFLVNFTLNSKFFTILWSIINP